MYGACKFVSVWFSVKEGYFRQVHQIEWTEGDEPIAKGFSLLIPEEFL